MQCPVTRQEIEQKMDELAREYRDTHDPEIIEETSLRQCFIETKPDSVQLEHSRVYAFSNHASGSISASIPEDSRDTGKALNAPLDKKSTQPLPQQQKTAPSKATHLFILFLKKALARRPRRPPR
jgi:hypothetical protein